MIILGINMRNNFILEKRLKKFFDSFETKLEHIFGKYLNFVKKKNTFYKFLNIQPVSKPKKFSPLVVLTIRNLKYWLRFYNFQKMLAAHWTFFEKIH